MKQLVRSLANRFGPDAYFLIDRIIAMSLKKSLPLEIAANEFIKALSYAPDVSPGTIELKSYGPPLVIMGWSRDRLRRYMIFGEEVYRATTAEEIKEQYAILVKRITTLAKEKHDAIDDVAVDNCSRAESARI